MFEEKSQEIRAQELRRCVTQDVSLLRSFLLFVIVDFYKTFRSSGANTNGDFKIS